MDPREMDPYAILGMTPAMLGAAQVMGPQPGPQQPQELVNRTVGGGETGEEEEEGKIAQEDVHHTDKWVMRSNTQYV